MQQRTRIWFLVTNSSFYTFAVFQFGRGQGNDRVVARGPVAAWLLETGETASGLVDGCSKNVRTYFSVLLDFSFLSCSLQPPCPAFNSRSSWLVVRSVNFLSNVVGLNKSLYLKAEPLIARLNHPIIRTLAACNCLANSGGEGFCLLSTKNGRVV